MVRDPLSLKTEARSRNSTGLEGPYEAGIYGTHQATVVLFLFSIGVDKGVTSACREPPDGTALS